MNHAPSSRTGKLLIRPTSGEPGWRRQRTGRHIQGEGIPLKGPGREPMTLWSHACRHRRNHSHSVVDSMCWWLTEWATGKVLSGQDISSISRDPKSWLPAINTHQHLRPTGAHRRLIRSGEGCGLFAGHGRGHYAGRTHEGCRARHGWPRRRGGRAGSRLWRPWVVLPGHPVIRSRHPKILGSLE